MTLDAHTNQELMLDVSDGHQLYVQDWGNKDAATPIIMLHGGPGGGSSDSYKQRFAPEKHRVIFFDQRGAGRSLPLGSLEHNTTQDLIADITSVANHLGIEKFWLVGGSWGATLALIYGIEHPERVTGMVLNGIFTATKAENDWLHRGGFEAFFPDVWEHYASQAPAEARHNPGEFFLKQSQSNDPEAVKAAAYAYSNTEGALVRLDDRFTPGSYENYDPASSLIEMHYLANGCFIPEGHITENAHKLTMPVWLVQGRYDMVCPPVTAYKLHQKLPQSQLLWTMAGHTSDRSNFDTIRTLLLQIGD